MVACQPLLSFVIEQIDGLLRRAGSYDLASMSCRFVHRDAVMPATAPKKLILGCRGAVLGFHGQIPGTLHGRSRASESRNPNREQPQTPRADATCCRPQQLQGQLRIPAPGSSLFQLPTVLGPFLVSGRICRLLSS